MGATGGDSTGRGPEGNDIDASGSSSRGRASAPSRFRGSMSRRRERTGHEGSRGSVGAVGAVGASSPPVQGLGASSEAPPGAGDGASGTRSAAPSSPSPSAPARAGDGTISIAGGVPSDGADPPGNVPGTPGGNKPGDTPTPGGISPAGNALRCPDALPASGGFIAAVAATRSAATGALSENVSTYFDLPFCARMLNAGVAAAG